MEEDRENEEDRAREEIEGEREGRERLEKTREDERRVAMIGTKLVCRWMKCLLQLQRQ